MSAVYESQKFEEISDFCRSFNKRAASKTVKTGEKWVRFAPASEPELEFSQNNKWFIPFCRIGSSITISDGNEKFPGPIMISILGYQVMIEMNDFLSRYVKICPEEGWKFPFFSDVPV